MNNAMSFGAQQGELVDELPLGYRMHILPHAMHRSAPETQALIKSLHTSLGDAGEVALGLLGETELKRRDNARTALFHASYDHAWPVLQAALPPAAPLEWVTRISRTVAGALARQWALGRADDLEPWLQREVEAAHKFDRLVEMHKRETPKPCLDADRTDRLCRKLFPQIFPERHAYYYHQIQGLAPEQIKAECALALAEIGPQQPWEKVLKPSDPEKNRGLLAESWKVINALSTEPLTPSRLHQTRRYSDDITLLRGRITH